LLQEALEKTMPRFPCFDVRMRNGFFWHYLEKNPNGAPPVMLDIGNPCLRVKWKENNGNLIKIYYYENRISAEFYHAVTDGYGASRFFMTLLAVYLRLTGKEIPNGESVFDINEKPHEEESEDAYLKYSNSKAKGKRFYKFTYHYKGKRLPKHRLCVTTGYMPVSALKEKAHEYGVTITEYLAAVLLWVMYNMQEEEENNKEKQLVLRYTPYFKQYVDVKGLLDSGKKYYFERNYDKCIECYKKTLQFGEPSISAYVRIGLSYYRKFERELAADYLTIATELSKKRDKKYDFSDMIMRLNGEIKEEDKKTGVIINEEEFKYGNYNINNLNDVKEYIYNTNKKVSDVCKELGMNTEEINLVILLYAKRYYIQGDYEKGEEFLKAVEKNKEKTDKVRKALDEIKRNKKLYMNKHSDYNLKLTLKP